MYRKGLITAAFLLMFCLPGCAGSQGFDASLGRIVAPYRFNLVGWELQTVPHELEDLVFGDGAADNSALVVEYFSAVGQTAALEQQIGAIKSGQQTGDLAPLEAELTTLQEKTSSLEREAERIIEAQVRETLAGLGIFNPLDGYVKLGLNFPPVTFVLQEPPHLLVVSPRNRIERIKEVILVQDMTQEQMENIEAAVDGLGVSSLVVTLGGIATYPAFVTNDSGLRFALSTAIEEWLHQYLFFKPLGFNYVLYLLGATHNDDIAVINETLAGMVSQEVSDILYQRYYSQYEQGGGQPGTGEPEFDFNQEMRNIRKAVDEYLARGEIDKAEAFMEQKRLFLASKGYFIRKLNQAFFAFYGSYANSPTSIDPIGTELRALRDQSPSLRDFLDTVSVMTSRGELESSMK